MKKSLFLILTLFLISPASFADSILRIHVIDVGYGDSILLEFPNRNIIIDAGTFESSRALVNYLRAQKVTQIQEAILTHPHKNHFGAYSAILNNFDVSMMFLNGDTRGEEGFLGLLRQLKHQRIPTAELKRGQALECPLENCEMKVLHPDKIRDSVNDSAIVMFLRYKAFTFLLTGDVHFSTLQELARLYPEITKAQFVQLPHHGRIEFEGIQPFTPKAFIVSYGFNPYGNIPEQSLDRLNTPIFRTDKQGTIVIETDGRTSSIKTQR